MENYAITLLDKLYEKGLKPLQIAQEIGVPRVYVYDWYKGHRKAQPSDLAAMAYLAGFDATQMLARATAEEFEGTKKGQLLARALGKTLLATGGVLASVSAQAASTGAIDTMYIMLSHIST